MLLSVLMLPTCLLLAQQSNRSTLQLRKPCPLLRCVLRVLLEMDYKEN